MDKHLGTDADTVPVRGDNELVTYVSVKMTVIEGMHPLERLVEGFTDLVYYFTIADEDTQFIGLYSNQPVDPIKLESQVPSNGDEFSKIIRIPQGQCLVL